MFEIRCPLRETAYVSKDLKGLVCPEGGLSFYEYDQLVTAAARKLQAAGVQAGERVGLAVNVGWRQPILFLAVLRAGAVACLFDPAMDKDRLAECAVSAACRRWIVSDPAAFPTGDARWSVHAAESFAELGAIGDFAGFEEHIPVARAATLVFTENSTGRRSILHTCGSHYYSALGCNAYTKLRSSNRYLLSPPMHEMEGLAGVFRCIMSGAALVVPRSGESLAQSIVEGEVTHASLTLKELEPLLTHPALRKSALKLVMVNEAVDKSLLKTAADIGIQVHSFFGLPEMASQITAVPFSSPPDKQTTRGTTLKYRSLRIGADGEIFVRGHTLMSAPADGGVTPVPLADEGWFDTGLKGRMDGEGYLTVLGGAA